VAGRSVGSGLISTGGRQALKPSAKITNRRKSFVFIVILPDLPV